MQRWTLVHCLEHHGEEFEWIAQFDTDEYLSLRSFPNVDALITSLQPADSVYVNWVFFGHAGHVERVPNLLLNYTRRQHGLDRHTRTITRRSAIRTDILRSDAFHGPQVAFYHGWKGRLGQGMRCVNVLGHDMASYYDDFGADERYVDEHKEQLFAAAVHHHYAFQSLGDFDRRVARGTAGEHAAQPNWARLSSASREEFLASIGAVEDLALHDYWQTYLRRAWDTPVLPAPEGLNLALGKPCRQSSIAEGGSDTARMAVNGQLGFTAAFETDAQAGSPVDPFWDVDIGEVQPVKLILIFNRLDQYSERAANLRIWLSSDGDHFDLVLEKTDNIAFGGVDGNPLIWRSTQPREARFVRISSADHVPLHLAQIEVY